MSVSMFDHLIDRATPEEPFTLAALMFEFDRQQRLGMALDELRDWIDGLFYDGKLVELAPGRYVKNPDPATVPPYTRVDEALYEAACAEMHSWHVEARKRLP